MKITSWLACFTVLAGCQFGDNLSLGIRPDSGVGSADATIKPIDGAIDAPPSQNACTVVPQSGCSGSTPACDIHDDGTTYCRGVTTAGTSNSHCVNETECKDGYTCTSVGPASTQKVCARFCTVDGQCTGTGSRCVIDLLNGNGDPLDVRVCSNACVPEDQTGCPSGMGCMPIEDAGGDFTDCMYLGTHTLGQACSSGLECSAGLICVGNSTTAYTCRDLCVVGAANPCGSTSLTCSGFASPLTVGSNTYGYCH